MQSKTWSDHAVSIGIKGKEYKNLAVKRTHINSDTGFSFTAAAM